MGLDAVELLMEVEEHFGISITADEGEHIRTVGDLVALIRSRAEAARSTEPHTARAFLSLRVLIREVLANPTARLKPSQFVVEQLTPRQCQLLWRRLPELTGEWLSPLRRPRPVRIALTLLSLSIIACSTAFTAFVDLAIFPLTIFLAIVSVALLYRLTSPLRSEPPDGMKTLGDITQNIVGRTAATKRRNLADDRAILAELAPIIVDVLGVDQDVIGMKTEFFKDLGCN
jgi:acyl carrier protein